MTLSLPPSLPPRFFSLKDLSLSLSPIQGVPNFFFPPCLSAPLETKTLMQNKKKVTSYGSPALHFSTFSETPCKNCGSPPPPLPSSIPAEPLCQREETQSEGRRRRRRCFSPPPPFPPPQPPLDSSLLSCSTLPPPPLSPRRELVFGIDHRRRRKERKERKRLPLKRSRMRRECGGSE